MDLTERLRLALEHAVNEGRNVVPDATDREAHLIESFAAHLLIAVEMAQAEQRERERSTDAVFVYDEETQTYGAYQFPKSTWEPYGGRPGIAPRQGS